MSRYISPYLANSFRVHEGCWTHAVQEPVDRLDPGCDERFPSLRVNVPHNKDLNKICFNV